MSDSVNLNQPGRKLHVGVILTKGQMELLDIAPIDLFTGLSKEFMDELPPDIMTDELKRQCLDVEFVWVNETGEVASLTGGLRILPTHSFANCPTLDIALMGAHTGEANEAELAFVRKTYESCSAFITICGGIRTPMRAGVLQGKKATAPKFMLDFAKKEVPDTKWVEQRWQRDGKLWTSGALLNGLDLMRAFASEKFGGKEDSLMEMLLKLGSWPMRDNDYSQAP